MSGYNKQRDIVAGLRIFMANGGTHCAAEHDVFFASQGDSCALSKDDVAALHSHGRIIMGAICHGCADDGDDAFEEEDGDRHLYDCTGWGLFV